MLPTFTLALVALASATRAQQIGTFTTEQHPELNWSSCTKAGCSAVKGSAVLDSEFRWIHNVNGTNNCYLGQGFNSTLCPDGDTCAKNCAIEGVDYSKTYGVTSTGSDLTLKYVTGSNVGSRLYLLDPSDAKYQLFKLKNKEFTFDVDVSTLACGLNGALYFVEMDADGGKSPNNKAGPRYGTGYCDAQCPTGLKFVNGKGNVEAKGACCNEMDIWEANSQATAYTPHPCDTGSTGLRTCTGDECNQVCDKGGCDYNTFRLGRKSFYGTDLAVDTTKRMTVVTQFLTNDGTDSGTLNEIRRLYVQDGKVIQNAKTNIPGIPTYDSITTQFCKDEKMAFGDTGSDPFEQYGGFNQLDKTFERGHVLALSLWDDLGSNMLWLDGEKWPLDADPLKPGVAKGNCSVTGPTAAELRKSIPDAFVTFANIKFGDIGTTFKGTTVDPAPSSSAPGSSVPSSSTPTSSASSASSTTSSAPTSVATQALYHQCGGVNWTGPTVCTSTATCVKQNDWYFQCLPK